MPSGDSFLRRMCFHKSSYIRQAMVMTIKLKRARTTPELWVVQISFIITPTFAPNFLPQTVDPVQNLYTGFYGSRIDPKASRRLKELLERRMRGLMRVFSGEHAFLLFIYGVQSYRPLYRYQPSMHQDYWRYQMPLSWLPPLLPTNPLTLVFC